MTYCWQANLEVVVALVPLMKAHEIWIIAENKVCGKHKFMKLTRSAK